MFVICCIYANLKYIELEKLILILFNKIQVYWVGPCLGAIGAALIYTQALKAPTIEIDISERYRTTADEKEVSHFYDFFVVN